MQTMSSTGGISLRGAVLAPPFLAVLALLLTAGALEESQRDQPVLLTIAVTLSLAGGALLAIRPSSRLAEVGALAAGVGVVVAIFLAASGASSERRPEISASFDERTATVSGTVAATNLGAEDRLAVQVDLQAIEEGQGIDDPEPFNPRGSLPIARATVGSDADGNAEHEFTLPVLINELYTHVVIEATSGDGERRCTELESPASPDGRTACMFIPVR